MEINNRIKYLTFFIVSLFFILTGFALSELDIMNSITPNDFDRWVDFLSPWIGDEDGGLPRPW